MASRPMFDRVDDPKGAWSESWLVGIANRPPEMFFFVRVTQEEEEEEETRLWDWCLCCFAKMAEGTKSLYLSAALYFSANFVTVTNQKLVADPLRDNIRELFDGDKYLYAPPPTPPKSTAQCPSAWTKQVITYTVALW